MERGPLQLLLRSTRRPMKQLNGSGETHAEGHDGSYQEAVEEKTYHELYIDFEIPTGPAPEQGFH
eukprot:2814597-Prorocentrum_lima.AAC.1